MFIQSRYQFNPSGKIFAFDLDGTLTTPKNGLDPAKYNEIGPNNWLFLGPIKQRLEELSKDYSIFIITNQTNISQTKQDMIASVWNALDGIPTVLCANKKGEYRKPNPGFVDVIRNMLGVNNINLLQGKSFYSGDAIGPTASFIPYKWKDNDYLFALNSGIPFIAPNLVFGHVTVMPTEDLVIMMGMPGSLKTTFAKGLESYGYARFSQDEISSKNLTNEVNTIIQTLLAGKKVVLDATFTKEEKRIYWIQVVQQLNIQRNLNLKVRILWCIRDGRPWNKEREIPVSKFAYVGPYGYVTNFTDPYISKDKYGYEITEMY